MRCAVPAERGVYVLRVVEGLSPMGRKVLISPLQTVQTTPVQFSLVCDGTQRP